MEAHNRMFVTGGLQLGDLHPATSLDQSQTMCHWHKERLDVVSTLIHIQLKYLN